MSALRERQDLNCYVVPIREVEELGVLIPHDGDGADLSAKGRLIDDGPEPKRVLLAKQKFLPSQMGSPGRHPHPRYLQRLIRALRASRRSPLPGSPYARAATDSRPGGTSVLYTNRSATVSSLRARRARRHGRRLRRGAEVDVVDAAPPGASHIGTPRRTDRAVTRRCGSAGRARRSGRGPRGREPADLPGDKARTNRQSRRKPV